ncbi:MAG: enoyl-CoA hydratase [Chloroflexi bacterium]|nr:enoyl-CoA hydratase [Chloroflexota bacterium]
MSYQYILYTVDSGIATLTLNRPDRMNALLEEMQPEFMDAIAKAKADDGVRVLIVTGAGKAFCSGADVSRLDRQMSGGSAHTLKKVTAPVGYFLLPLYDFPKPTIAMVNGPLAGGGISIALACELRVASEQARFMPAWLARGIAPDGGASWLLPRVIGYARAVEVLYTAKPLEAREALALGIYNRVVPADQLAGATRELALAIAAQPPIAVELAKRALQRGKETTLAEALDFETHAQQLCFKTGDFREAITAFREKRSPTFSGK